MKQRIAGQPATSQNRRDEARRRIIARSAGLLNARGYLRAPMSEVARVTGMKSNEIYRHFKNREALAIEVFRYAAGLAATQVVQVLERNGSAQDKLIALIGIFRAFRCDDVLRGGCPIVNLAIESEGSPRLGGAAREVMTKLIECFARVIEDGVKRGELPAVDARAHAAHMVAALEGGILLAGLYEDDEYLDSVADRLERQVRSGLQ
jgi:TetR/AcrR family transcriptional repressor of nem operon